jgi:hypothetical protein
MPAAGRSSHAVAASDPSSRVAGAPFSNLSETAELPALTNAVDVSEYCKLLWRSVLVLHKTKGATRGASGDSPSRLHKLCGNDGGFWELAHLASSGDLAAGASPAG